MTCADFLRAVFVSGYIDVRGFRALKDRRDSLGQRVSANNPELVLRMTTDLVERQLDVYVGVAERATTDNGRADNCLNLRALFVDVDFKDFDGDEHAARQRVAEFPHEPSIVVASGGGLQCYWLLTEPINLQGDGIARAKHLLRALAQATGADLKAAEPARILRLPGTRNFKYNPPRDVVLETLADRRYELAALEAALPLHNEPPQDPPADALDHQVDGNTRKVLAANWASRQPPAIEGQGGDTRTFTICCAVAIGFDLTPGDALDVLRPWNARCVPPWSEADLHQKISGAIRYGKEARGGRLLAFPLSEEGDAQAFAALYRDNVRYFHRSGSWAMTDERSGIWVPDVSEQIIRYTSNLMVERYRHATTKEARTWAHAGHSRKRIMNAHVLARSVAPISVPANDMTWDTRCFLLGVPNGVVDLRDGSHRLAHPDEKITMRARIAYEPTAICPLWEQTIREIFTFTPNDGLLPLEDAVHPEDRAQSLVTFLQRAIGYTLTGDVREECFFICWGTGRNGKGTLINLIYWLLGDYAENLSMGTLESNARRDSEAPRPSIAKLPGKRMVISSENRKATKFDEEMIKRVTGRDTVTVRQLYKPEFNFDPAFKLWLMVNNKPEGIREEDAALWARIHLVPFLRSFDGCADTTLKDRLKGEAAGILSWAVRGAMAWQREGLNPPAVVRAATKQYRAESDQLALFLADRCVVKQGACAKTGDLLRSYEEWCRECGQEVGFNHKTFTPALVARGYQIDQTKPKSHTWIQGIGLIADRSDREL